MTQQGDGFIRKPYFGFAVAGVALAAAFLCVGSPIAKAVANRVVYLRSLMPAEQVEETPQPIGLQPVAEPLPDVNELQLLEKLYTESAPASYRVAENVERWQVVRMRVTAYCPCPKCCGKFSDGITACNHRIGRGDTFVAADKAFRFGTDMIIPGYNANRPVEVKDRGRLIKGNRLDVFFNSHKQAKKWGTQYLDVMVRVK